ncbi:universal stress protein [Guyparkeria hydrothermalis]|uniref:universal stress protein n=1 Tax=Guyparkeria hydrothermalis TaxID=923 RepID=UPI0020222239|nr:universal stress protein [Guyparkeria hydrothermalis]MCL7744403.1 universal stress protein [Guyparkeria hydrothermalis]
MSQPRPILIASDLSPASDAAVTRGLQLADQRGCSVILLHVIREEPLWWVIMSRELDPEELRAALAREATAGLQDQVRQGVSQLGIASPRVEIVVRWGKPAALITEAAESREAELIVAGTDTRPDASRWIIGSTAEKLVRAGSCPVLVVRHSPGPGYARIAAAVDFSPASREALAEALALAPEASFTLIHSYETWFETYIDPATYERLRYEQEEALHERLRAFAHDAGVREGQDVDYQVVAGLPGVAVLDAAHAFEADLVVCGTQGETGLRHLLLGSVAQHILRSAGTDVLAVRASSAGG